MPHPQGPAPILLKAPGVLSFLTRLIRYRLRAHAIDRDAYAAKPRGLRAPTPAQE